MNANELADELEEFSGNGAFKYYLEIATMLRQQQAEIEALKTELSFFQKEKSTEELKLANRYFDKAQEK